MTGEVTLRGRVLPIGGLKEKLLAALRGGIKTVLIPKENEKDLAEIPDNVKKGLKIIPVATVDEVLRRALVRQPQPIEWTEVEAPAVPAATRIGRGADRTVAELTLSVKKIGFWAAEFGKKAGIGGRCTVDDFARPALLYADLLEIAPAGCAIVKGVCAVNKNDLFVEVAKKTGMSKADVGKAVDATLDAIIGGVEEERRRSLGRLRHLLGHRAQRDRRAQSAHRRSRSGSRPPSAPSSSPARASTTPSTNRRHPRVALPRRRGAC